MCGRFPKGNTGECVWSVCAPTTRWQVLAAAALPDVNAGNLNPGLGCAEWRGRLTASSTRSSEDVVYNKELVVLTM